MHGELIWMYRGGETGQALEDGVGGGVEEFVRNAIDAPVGDGTLRLPVALLDNASQGNTISGAAPGEDENVWVRGCDGFGGGGLACVAKEFAASGFD